MPASIAYMPMVCWSTAGRWLTTAITLSPVNSAPASDARNSGRRRRDRSIIGVVLRRLPSITPCGLSIVAFIAGGEMGELAAAAMPDMVGPLVDPDDLAAHYWDMYTKRDRVEQIHPQPQLG